MTQCIPCEQNNRSADYKRKSKALELAKERAIAWAKRNGKEVMVIFKTVNGYGFQCACEPIGDRQEVERICVD